MLTGFWGKETIDRHLSYAKEDNLSNFDFTKKSYLDFRGIDISNFDFRKNYL
jgi:hypothetical protein